MGDALFDTTRASLNKKEMAATWTTELKFVLWLSYKIMGKLAQDLFQTC